MTFSLKRRKITQNREHRDEHFNQACRRRNQDRRRTGNLRFWFFQKWRFDMNVLLATHLVFLAQGYDDTGAASRSSIIIGALAFPCLVIIAVVWQKLKNAKESEKHIEKLQKKVAELEQEQEQKWEDTAEDLEEATLAKQPVIKPTALGNAARPFRVVHVDDEDWLLEMVKLAIRPKFTNVSIDTFQNGDEAWKELLRTDPDLLITDLSNANVPGRTQNFGKSGFELLALLAERKVKYPILVLSGSLAIAGYQSKVRQVIGSDLNVSFLKKPITTEQLYAELSKAVLKTDASESKNRPENSASFPKRMEFQIGGFLGSSHKINHVGSGKLEYFFAENNYEWADPIILEPQCEQWDQFWRDIDQIGLWKWEASYMNSRILDGTYWCLDFQISEKSLKTEGKNLYPGSNGKNSPSAEFLTFLKAVRNLTGVEEIG